MGEGWGGGARKGLVTRQPIAPSGQPKWKALGSRAHHSLLS